MENITWNCHARPAALSGKPCGHKNEGKSAIKTRFLGQNMLCCASCGCTKKASDDREAKETLKSGNQLPKGGKKA